MSNKRVFESTFGAYSEICLIGEGGASQVFDVNDSDGKAYALKLLRRTHAKGSESAKRFKNEVSFCIKNSHPHIVEIIDHGLFDDGNNKLQFCVMKKYDSSLRALMNEKAQMGKIVKYFSQILDGLEAAHLLGVTHRDIKPENILYSKKEDKLVVADFGIAEFSDESAETQVETRPGTRLANFQYASPEQRMRNKPVDHRTDIFSLGLIVIEMVTGEISLGTNSKQISDVFSELSYLDAITQKMISQDPKDRYSSIVEIKKDLIGRQSEYIQMQRLDFEKKRVISEADISDDPLLEAPNEIVNVDWNNNSLTIQLKYAASQKWIQAFQNMGSYSSLLGHGPETFRIQNNKVTCSCRSNEAQDMINYFKQWLIQTFNTYRSNTEAERDHSRRMEIEKQQKRIREEEERLRTIQSLRF